MLVQSTRATAYSSILERFSQDAVFAASLLNEGENEYDCERYDLLRHVHLPEVDRTRAQMQLGISEQSQLEDKATRLVYLDVHDQKDVPDRFHYIGQSWLFMYRTEIYSEDEYIDYLKWHPENNLLMTNMGMIEISVDEADRHLAWVKNQNRESYRKNGEDKRKQSERAKAHQEAKMKAEAASAYGHAPAKRGTVSSVAQTSQEATSAPGASSSHRSEPPHRERVETGEWQKWYGRWYQKIIRFGRTESEAW